MKTVRINENFRLRKRPDGIYELAWEDLETGKTKRKTTGMRSKQLANMQLASMVADVRAPKISESITVGALIDLYIKAFIQNKPDKFHSHATLKASLKPVKKKLGGLRWDQLSQDEIDNYVTWRMSQTRWIGKSNMKKATGTVGPSTVNKDLRMLRAAITDSHARRYIPHEVKFKINVTPTPPKDVWLTKKEVTKLLDACEFNKDGTARRRSREHLYAFILISVATAARKEAVLSLKWDQVYIPRPEDLPEDVGIFDYKNRKVNGNAYIDFGEGSGNKRRPKMPVGNNLLLMNYLAFGGDRDQPYVISYRGKALDDIKKGFAELLREVGIKKKVTPHSLKHTAITWLVQSGMALETISELTNTSVKILRSTYAHHRPDYQAALGSALAL